MINQITKNTIRDNTVYGVYVFNHQAMFSPLTILQVTIRMHKIRQRIHGVKMVRVTIGRIITNMITTVMVSETYHIISLVVTTRMIILLVTLNNLNNQVVETNYQLQCRFRFLKPQRLFGEYNILYRRRNRCRWIHSWISLAIKSKWHIKH